MTIVALKGHEYLVLGGSLCIFPCVTGMERFFFFLMIDTTSSFIIMSEKRKFYDAEIYKNEVY